MRLSEELEDSLPASLLRQYLFCPRIPFYHEVLNIYPATRLWQSQGVDYHQREAMLLKRRNLAQFGIEDAKLEHNVSLKSSKLSIHGICDAVLISEREIAVLEFKLRSSVKVQKGHIYQLAAYALMAEEAYNKPCNNLFVLYGDKGKTHQVKCDSVLKQDLIKKIAEIKASFKKPVLPASPATEKQCGQCEYLNFCADRNDGE